MSNEGNIIKVSKELTNEGFWNVVIVCNILNSRIIKLGTVTNYEFSYIKYKYPNIYFKK